MGSVQGKVNEYEQYAAQYLDLEYQESDDNIAYHFQGQDFDENSMSIIKPRKLKKLRTPIAPVSVSTEINQTEKTITIEDVVTAQKEKERTDAEINENSANITINKNQYINNYNLIIKKDEKNQKDEKEDKVEKDDEMEVTLYKLRSPFVPPPPPPTTNKMNELDNKQVITPALAYHIEHYAETHKTVPVVKVFLPKGRNSPLNAESKTETKPCDAIVSVETMVGQEGKQTVHETSNLLQEDKDEKENIEFEDEEEEVEDQEIQNDENIETEEENVETEENVDTKEENVENEECTEMEIQTLENKEITDMEENNELIDTDIKEEIEVNQHDIEEERNFHNEEKEDLVSDNFKDKFSNDTPWLLMDTAGETCDSYEVTIC